MDFPKIKVTYLDSAATSLTPNKVIEAMDEYYKEYNASVHRSIHEMGERATKEYEDAREKVAKFIGAETSEVIFTSGTTQSLNMLAYKLIEGKKGNVVLTESEHHSNMVPWQQHGLELRYIPVKPDFTLDLNKAKELIDENTLVVSVCHVSNILGLENPVKELAKMAHKKKALLVVDAAQSVPHMTIDVKELGCDFLAFSGHKMLGPTGVGVLYGKKELLEDLDPVVFGGEMIKSVTLEGSTFNDLPWKFEAGTPNVAGVIGIGAAIDCLLSYGMEKVKKHSEDLAQKAKKMLQGIGAEIYGGGNGIVSFNFKNIHPHDVASILDSEGIAIRAGHNCAMPLHKKLGITGSCRMSFHVYNKEDDIEKTRKALLKAKEVLHD